MAFNTRLYADPTAMNACTLAITGTLPDYVSGEAYEGRLQVTGAVGRVSILSLVHTLPPGARVWIDRVTGEIVVDWPAHAEPAPVAQDAVNKDFESGDDGWVKGAGWSIVQNDVNADPTTPTSTWAARFGNQGGESEILSEERIPAVAGQSFSASCRVQQGASSENNAGAAVRLVFFDADGKRIVTTNTDGNVIKSGSNSNWQTSNITVAAPANTAAAVLGASAYRKRQNHPLWVDNLVWNGANTPVTPIEQGHDEDEEFEFAITLRDGKQCQASWSGLISESYYYLTTRPYAVTALESFGTGYGVKRGYLLKEISERFVTTYAVVSGELRQILKTYTNAVPDTMATAFGVNPTGDIRTILKATPAQPPDTMQAVFGIRPTGEIKQVLITYSRYVPESFSTNFSLLSGALA